MKMKCKLTNRILSLTLALVMVVGLLPVTSMTVYAATSVSCGENLTYDFSEGILTVSGTGAMYDYNNTYSLPPWKDQEWNIYSVVIEPDVTYVGNYAFYAFQRIEKVTIKGDTALGVGSFHTCPALKYVEIKGEGIIGSAAFKDCDSLATVKYNGTITDIDSEAFTGCENLSSFTLREGVGSPDTSAFYKSTNVQMTLVDANGNDKTEYYEVEKKSLGSSTSNSLKIYGDLSKGKIEPIAEQQFTGSEIKPGVTVTWNGQTVSPENYTVSYENNTAAGTATVTVTGNEGKYYKGTLTGTFTIIEPPMSGVSAQNVTATYDGEAHGITVSGAPSGATVTYSKSKNGTYTATQPSVINVADSGTIYYKVSATGYQDYYGSANVTINPKDIKECTVANIPNQTYTGSAIIPDVTVTDNGTQLAKGTDYTVSGSSVKAGAGSVTIAGSGNYTGSVSKIFNINAANISAEMVTLNPENGTYTGSAYTPSITVTFNGTPLVKDTDYTLSWDKDGLTTPDTYTVRVVGEGNFAGSVDKSFKINAASLSNIKVEQAGTLTYNGAEQTPTVSTNAVAVNEQPITFTYSKTEGGTYSEEVPSFKDAGSHTVYYKVNAPNHNEATGSFTVKIDKAEVTEPTINSKVYNGYNQRADIIETAFYTVTENNGGTDVGNEYKVTLTLKDSKNYKWKTTDNAAVTLTFEITKADAAVTTAPAAKPALVYNKDPQALINAGIAVGGELQYSLDGVSYSAAIPTATNADTYTVYYKVVGDRNHNGTKPETLTVTINKKTVDLSGVKWTYTEPFKYTGLIQEVSIVESTVPEGASVSGYKGHSKVDTGKYQAEASIVYDGNHKGEATLLFNWEIKNEWIPTEYTVTALNDDGWLNQDFVITAAEGYRISTNNTDGGPWADKLTYSGETDNGHVTFYLRNIADNTISLEKTVTYKLDKTVPTGRVELDEKNGWDRFLELITFKLYYKDEVTVKVTANDTLSDISKIEYAYSNEAKSLNEVKEIADWIAMPENGVGVTVEDAKQFVYFVRITDKAGNVTYLSTDGAEYDTSAPEISGVENGKTYYTTQKVTVTDKNIDSITLDNLDADADITLVGNTEATYTIIATDKAGNSTTVTVTMKTIKELAKATENLGGENVTSDDAPALEELVKTLDELIADPDTSEDGEKETLEQHKIVAENLLKAIEDAAKATETENIEKVKNTTPENVTPENKTDLEGAKADLEKALKEKAGNYTEDEKKAIENELGRIEDALEVIGNVEAVEELIEKLPDTIKNDDEAAIIAAEDAFGALTDYEKSLVDKDAKKVLSNAKAALAELKKLADSNSPATEDNSNVWLWFALMLVSGASLLGITLNERKRKFIGKK